MATPRMNWRRWNPNLIGALGAATAWLLTGSLLLPLGVMAIVAVGGFFGGRGLFQAAAGQRAK